MDIGLAGAAARDITPAWPVLQAGFGQRQQPSTGVLDRIFAKALYLRGASGSLLLLTADLICIPRPLARAVVDQLVARVGIDPAQVCICASHTHSAPVPWDASGTAPGIREWTPLLVAALVDAGCEALATAVPARLRTATGRFDLLRNRWTRGAPNDVDPRVPVVVVDDARTGAVRAVLSGLGCHPVTLGWDSSGISGDFPGHAQQRVEAALPGAQAMFFNMTEGDVIPATSPDRDALDPRGYCGGSEADTERMAGALAAVVHAAVQEARPAAGFQVHAGVRELAVRPAGADLDAATAAARLAAARAVLEEWLGAGFEDRIGPGALWAAASARVMALDPDEAAMRRLMLACCDYLGLVGWRPDRPVREVAMPVQLLRIGDLAVLALPGEVLVAVGRDWSRRTGLPGAHVMALANAHSRYLPHPDQFAGADARQHYETVTAGLEPAAVGRALDAGLALLAQSQAGVR